MKKEVTKMRNMVYRLADGRVVKTHAEAKNSKMNYEVVMEDVFEEFDENKLSEKRRALRRTLV